MSKVSVQQPVAHSSHTNGARGAAVTSRQKGIEERIVWKARRLMTFEQYLDRFTGAPEHIELIKGVPVERMAAQIEHELLQVFLLRLVGDFVEEQCLGLVLGSRSAVKIDQFGGRLPDILFISNERMAIVEQRGIYGAPNLVIEIRSPGDRASDIASLEADYRSCGIPEIWFIQPKRKSVRILRQVSGGYREEEVKSGILHSSALRDFWIDLNWLFGEPRLTVRNALKTIMAGPAL